MTECLFCRIAGGELSAATVYEDDQVVAFSDIHPQAPVHVLIIPRRHITTVSDLGEDTAGLMDRLIHTANRIAREQGVDKSGYRIVVNCNADGGQSVYHLHLHLLGGRKMAWPPG